MIFIFIPAAHLPSKRFRPTIRNAFGHYLVASLQKPKELFIASGSAIQAPNRALALLRS
jgi:hypothetical protein